jgi:hypothetical protein
METDSSSRAAGLRGTISGSHGDNSQGELLGTHSFEARLTDSVDANKGGKIMRYLVCRIGSLVVGLALLAGCGTPSPIDGLIDLVKDDPAAKKFLKSWPLPEGFELTGSPQFQRTRQITPGKEVVRIGEIHFSGLGGNMDQAALLEFYRTALTKKGYEVTSGEAGGLEFSGAKWSGRVAVSSDEPSVVAVDAAQGDSEGR